MTVDSDVSAHKQNKTLFYEYEVNNSSHNKIPFDK